MRTKLYIRYRGLVIIAAHVLAVSMIVGGCRSSSVDQAVSDDLSEGNGSANNVASAPTWSPHLSVLDTSTADDPLGEVDERVSADRPHPVDEVEEHAVDSPQAMQSDADNPASPSPELLESESTDTPEADRPSDESAYRVQVGDSVTIEVFQEPDISRMFTISSEGTINHPLLGKTEVTGLTIEEIESRIHDLLGADYLVDPRVIVSLSDWTGGPVVLFGEVKKPGAYSIPPGGNLTLLELIGQAGGFTEIASRNRVRIVRKRGDEEKTIKVKVSDLLKRGDKEDVALEPGDVVTVPRTLF